MSEYSSPEKMVAARIVEESEINELESLSLVVAQIVEDSEITGLKSRPLDLTEEVQAPHGSTGMAILLNPNMIMMGADTQESVGEGDNLDIITDLANKIVQCGQHIMVVRSGNSNHFPLVFAPLMAMVNAEEEAERRLLVRDCAALTCTFMKANNYDVELIFCAIEDGVGKIAYANKASWMNVKDCWCIGSGAKYVYPIIKNRCDQGLMTPDECKELIRFSILVGSDNDPHTGGFAQIYVMLPGLNDFLNPLEIAALAQAYPDR